MEVGGGAGGGFIRQNQCRVCCGVRGGGVQL